MLNASNQYNILELISKGGWVMLPLLLCSLLAVAIILERLIWGPRRKRVIPNNFDLEIEKLINKQRFEEIVGLCKANNSPIARVILVAIQNKNVTREELREVVELAGKKESSLMLKYLGALGTIAAISPLLGLLGTVFGMITTFAVIQNEGVGNATALSGGIAQALLTTAVGLTIAIPSLVFYRYFLSRAKQLTLEMESIALKIIHEPSFSVKSVGSVSTIHKVQ